MVPVVSVYDKSDVERNVGFSNSAAAAAPREFLKRREKERKSGRKDSAA